MIRMVRRFGTLLFFVVLLFVLSRVNRALNESDTSWVQPPNEQHARWSERVMRAMTLGQTQSTADWMWLVSMTDPAYTHVVRGAHPPLYYHLDLATDLDPAFFEAYWTGGMILSIIRADHSGAIQLLYKGTKFYETKYTEFFGDTKRKFWSAWSLYMSIAYVELFEMNHMTEAAHAFIAASKVPGAPAFLVSLAERLSKPGGAYEVGMRLLNHMIDTASDQKTKLALENKRKSLFLAQHLDQLNRMFDNFLGLISDEKKKTPVQRNGLWWQFLQRMRMQPIDPWGGKLILNEKGHIITTTDYEKVFGLE